MQLYRLGLEDTVYLECDYAIPIQKMERLKDRINRKDSRSNLLKGFEAETLVWCHIRILIADNTLGISITETTMGISIADNTMGNRKPTML